MKKTKIIAFLILIAVVLLWGVAPVMAKAIYDAEPALYSPGILTALRGLFAVIAMALFINKGFKKVNKSYLICIPAGLILLLSQSSCSYSLEKNQHGLASLLRLSALLVLSS